MQSEIWKENIKLADVEIVRTPHRRFLGLMGKKSLPAGKGLFFPNCNSLHSFFMRFPIEIILLDRDLKIVKIISSFLPWRLLWPVRKARHALEFNQNELSAKGVCVGDQLSFGKGGSIREI